MSEYILTEDITTYHYPTHMKRPDGFFGSNFFVKWIPQWKTHLSHLKNKNDVVGIEIGGLYGDCAVWCAENICNGKNSIHYTIDIDPTEYLINNIQPLKNIKLIKGDSSEVLINFNHNNINKHFADYVYVDGSHISIDVLRDAVFSWHLLKEGGVLIFDDYGWGIHTNDNTLKPKTGIDAFLKAYEGHYEIIQFEWQIFLKKKSIFYKYNKETFQMERC